jgi:hypothetical protein
MVKKIKRCSLGLPLLSVYSSLIISKSPSFRILVSILINILYLVLSYGTHGSQFGYSITEIFHYLTLSLIFPFYLLFFFIFYILLALPSASDEGIENFLESGSAELYLSLTPILVILFMTTGTFPLL